MRNVPKNYHDENYRDPVPIGVCAKCGEEILLGSPYYQNEYGELFHASGVLRRYQEINTKRPLFLSCAMSYILDSAGQEDLAKAIGLVEKK